MLCLVSRQTFSSGGKKISKRRRDNVANMTTFVYNVIKCV